MAAKADSGGSKPGRKYWAILFKEESITGKRSKRLTPEGGLTDKKMFAAMFTDRERAVVVADEIQTKYPEATVSVVTF